MTDNHLETRSRPSIRRDQQGSNVSLSIGRHTSSPGVGTWFEIIAVAVVVGATRTLDVSDL
jgi:hypothetical protein